MMILYYTYHIFIISMSQGEATFQNSDHSADTNAAEAIKKNKKNISMFSRTLLRRSPNQSY